MFQDQGTQRGFNFQFCSLIYFNRNIKTDSSSFPVEKTFQMSPLYLLSLPLLERRLELMGKLFFCPSAYSHLSFLVPTLDCGVFFLKSVPFQTFKEQPYLILLKQNLRILKYKRSCVASHIVHGNSMNFDLSFISDYILALLPLYINTEKQNKTQLSFMASGGRVR